MRQAGRYLPEYRAVRSEANGFLDLCYTPDLAVEVTLQPIRRYGFDAAILFSDILVVPDALGCEVRFVEGEGPKLETFRDERAVARLSKAGLHNHLAPVYETLKRLRQDLPAETALIRPEVTPIKRVLSGRLEVSLAESRPSKDAGLETSINPKIKLHILRGTNHKF